MKTFLNQISDTEKRFYSQKPKHDKIIKMIEKEASLLEMDDPVRVQKRLTRLHIDPSLPQIVQERLIGKNDLMNVNYFELGLRVAKTVGRISIRNQSKRVQGYGTGFLVSPQLLLTNNHVLPTLFAAKFSQVEFNYQYDCDGRLLPSLYYDLRPEVFYITNSDLDYSLVALSPLAHDQTPLSELGHNLLIEEEGKAVLGECVSIIQHPNGEPKQIAIRENQLIGLDPDFLQYYTDTAQGSSGSLVCSDQWEVIGLHHSGVPRRDENNNILRLDGGIWTYGMSPLLIDWKANEGVRISRIIKNLREKVAAETDGVQRLFEEMLEIKHPSSTLKPSLSPSPPEQPA
ncbi:hypothetical protein BH24BAC1_BH24BAC1_26470 [soil metagenome]